MGDGFSACFGTRDKVPRLHTTDFLDNKSEYTPEPKTIDTDNKKVTFDPKCVTKDERSYNLEDKVSETKNSRAATLLNGRFECDHPLEDSKKSSTSELQDMLERKDTNELVSFALQNENFVPGPQYAEANQRKMIIEDELKYEEKIVTLLPESKSDQPQKGRHIKTDSELIHQMLYSSESSDSFECCQDESKNRL